MKTAEPLDTDKLLQMLVDTRSYLPCVNTSNDEEFCKDFCKDFCKPDFNGPQKECWLHYIEWRENH